MNNFSYGGSGGQSGFGTLKVMAIIVLILGILIYFGSCSSNWITEQKAMDRLVEMTGMTDIVIVRSSNASPIFGDPNNVTFEIKIKGKNASARFTSGAFSEMVCRIYYEGEGD
jgi:hypothetical protein